MWSSCRCSTACAKTFCKVCNYFPLSIPPDLFATMQCGEDQISTSLQTCTEELSRLRHHLQVFYCFFKFFNVFPMRGLASCITELLQHAVYKIPINTCTGIFFPSVHECVIETRHPIVIQAQGFRNLDRTNYSLSRR